MTTENPGVSITTKDVGTTQPVDQTPPPSSHQEDTIDVDAELNSMNKNDLVAFYKAEFARSIQLEEETKFLKSENEKLRLSYQSLQDKPFVDTVKSMGGDPDKFKSLSAEGKSELFKMLSTTQSIGGVKRSTTGEEPAKRTVESMRSLMLKTSFPGKSQGSSDMEFAPKSEINFTGSTGVIPPTREMIREKIIQQSMEFKNGKRVGETYNAYAQKNEEQSTKSGFDK